jgi:peptide/nickel transport system ATP-binding protein
LAFVNVQDLRIEFRTARGQVRAADGISFKIEQGGSLGLVGESGCGKSTTGYGIMRLLPENARITGGQVLFDGTDLLILPEAELRRIRWGKISMVFQNAMSALNPVMRISDQINGALILHHPMSKKEAMERATAAFAQVGLTPSRLSQYPHEFSGGMKQRVMIAMALICDPQLVIADEPTTALDVVAQRQILQLLGDLKERLNLTLILISHDISAVGEVCRQVGVMYAGQVVEFGPNEQVLYHYRHPYTQALVKSLPSLYTPVHKLVSLPGAPPDLIAPPPGCRFAPRCPYVQPICNTEPPMITAHSGHVARCHFATTLALEGAEGERKSAG